MDETVSIKNNLVSPYVNLLLSRLMGDFLVRTRSIYSTSVITRVTSSAILTSVLKMAAFGDHTALIPSQSNSALAIRNNDTGKQLMQSVRFSTVIRSFTSEI